MRHVELARPGLGTRRTGGARRATFGHSPFRIPHSAFKGFTLVELLVVLGIIGLVAAMSVPAFNRFVMQTRLKTATREIVGLLSLARSLAIGSRSARTVVVDLERGEAFIEESMQQGDARMVRFSSSVTISGEAPGQEGQPTDSVRFTFKPSGALTGASTALILSSGSRTQTVSVSAATGAIHIQ